MTAYPHDTHPPANHVFVDFENVHEVDLSVIGAKTVTLTLLLGPRQAKLDIGLAERLIQHAASVQLIRLESSGKNALDFVLSYYLGRAVAADPTAYFHIISRDTGFDPLVEHLKTRAIKVRRHEDFSTLTFSGPPKQVPVLDDATAHVLEILRKNATNRPKKKKTLLAHLKSHLGKDGTDAAAMSLLEKLRKAKHIGIDEKEAVTYTL